MHKLCVEDQRYCTRPENKFRIRLQPPSRLDNILEGPEPTKQDSHEDSGPIATPASHDVSLDRHETDTDALQHTSEAAQATAHLNSGSAPSSTDEIVLEIFLQPYLEITSAKVLGKSSQATSTQNGGTSSTQVSLQCSVNAQDSEQSSIKRIEYDDGQIYSILNEPSHRVPQYPTPMFETRETPTPISVKAEPAQRFNQKELPSAPEIVTDGQGVVSYGQGGPALDSLEDTTDLNLITTSGRNEQSQSAAPGPAQFKASRPSKRRKFKAWVSRILERLLPEDPPRLVVHRNSRGSRSSD